MKNFQNSYKKPSETQTADNTINNFDQVNYLTITPNQDGQRIDNFLLTRLKGLPKSHLYNMIRRDEIRINGKRCKAFNRLNVGDVVRIAPVRLATRDNVMISDDFAKSLLSRILYEDDGLIVLNKPYGIAVHGGSGESFGIIEAIRFATGKKYLEHATSVQATVIGKPSKIIMECAIELFDYKKEEIVMVGDNYDTDIMSGINSGIDTIHVQTGVTTLENLKLKKIQPTYTIEDLSKLIED